MLNPQAGHTVREMPSTAMKPLEKMYFIHFWGTCTHLSQITHRYCLTRRSEVALVLRSGSGDCGLAHMSMLPEDVTD